VDLAKRSGAKVFGPAGLVQTLIDLGWLTASRACASARVARCSRSGRRSRSRRSARALVRADGDRSGD